MGFAGVDLGDDPVTAGEQLGLRCEHIERVNVDPPRLPLAKETESHLICRSYKDHASDIHDVVFVFADGALAMIELRGPGAAGYMNARLESDAVMLADYMGYPGDNLISSERLKAAWILDSDQFGSYAWLELNPHVQESAGGPASSAKQPMELAMNSALSDVEPVLTKKCTTHHTREIEDSGHVFNPDREMQIDCYGYDYAGYPRLIEAVFADDVLTHAWILTAKQEEGRVRHMLIDEYGPAVHKDDNWEVFADGLVALRKDRPEVLFMSEDMAQWFKENLLSKQE